MTIRKIKTYQEYSDIYDKMADIPFPEIRAIARKKLNSDLWAQYTFDEICEMAQTERKVS